MGARRALVALLALAPAPLVGGAIAASPDPSGPWTYLLGQRLLYIHVPLLWVAYVGFLAAVVAAVVVLARGDEEAARWMRAANEVTTIFAATGLAAGLAWSYEFQLFDPLADPKVLTTVVLVAALGGLWTLAASANPARRDRLVASLTVVAFAAVPASYLASRLATPHPDFTQPAQSIDGSMMGLLLVATLGFALFYIALVWTRTRVMRFEEARQPW